MHARGCRFQAAVEFLETLTGGLPAPAAATPADRPSAPPRLQLPPRDDRLWPPVRDFLVSPRGLDPALLDRCRQDGLLWADPRRNAVFLCRDSRRQPTGAEIAGTRPDSRGRTFKAMALGSRKAEGGFWLPSAAGDPAAILLVESALDALSALQLLASSLPPQILIASTAGVAPALPRWLQAFRAPRILCSYDADPAGDQAAEAHRRHTPHCRRLRPVGAKDWNDLLRNPRHSAHSPAPIPQQ